MKKQLLALLLTAGVLTGCGSAQVADRAELPENELPSLQVLPVRNLQYQVTLEPFERTASAEDGQLLASYQVQIPMMTVCLEDGTPVTEPHGEKEQQALEAADRFNQRFDIWREESSFRELADNAEADLLEKREAGLLPMEHYTLNLSCTVYQTDALVSVAGLCYSYTGGAHPNTWQLGWNFDLEHGDFFTGDVIAADSTGFRDAVAEELLIQAKAFAAENGMKLEDLYWPEYESTLRDWSSYTVYFDPTGMNVVFSPYELAPYAAGAQEFHLSYEWMRPRLQERGSRILGLTSDTEEK